MIDEINKEIEKFLSSIVNNKKNINSIIKKSSTSISDDLKKGHITSNVCMVAASILKLNPKNLAEDLKTRLEKIDKFDNVEVAGPGFLNISLNREDFVSTIEFVNKNKDSFGSSVIGKKNKVQIEFVSANPTGPLHVGHGRGAAYGDAIGRILESTGTIVEKEYYVNDAGRQIDILTASVILKLVRSGINNYFPKNAYKGKYIEEIANKLKKEIRVRYNLEQIIENIPQDSEEEIDKVIKNLKNLDQSSWNIAKTFSLKEIVSSIKDDLKNFKVYFDNWFNESSMGDIADSSSEISKSINKLKDAGHAYEKDGAIWLNTDLSGDDKHRVLIREDGRATYFASDVAYHKNKIDRGFNKLINVWGADHHGYIKRIEASLDGLGFEKEKLSVQLVQFANLFKDGKKVKMSTRSGDFYSLADLIKDIGTDAARFYYLSKQADQHLDFDLDLAKSDTKENMFYYIQYAHARICSLITKYEEEYSQLPKSAQSISNGSYKSCDKLIHEMSKYPHVVLRASMSLQPHLIIYYLKDFAHSFHSFYNDNQVLTESKENIDSIVFCLNAAKIVIANSLKLLGIEPIEKM